MSDDDVDRADGAEPGHERAAPEHGEARGESATEGRGDERGRNRAANPDPARAAMKTPGAGEEGLEALSAFVDGELSHAEDSVVRERIASDRQAASRVAAYAAQRAALQALCGADAGRAAAAPAPLVLRPREPWWWRGGLAASWVAVGAGLTLVASALLSGWNDAGTRMADDADGFARRADIAYAVYSPERRHPVEVGAADKAHLVAWLSKRLGRPLSIPSLQEYGYALVGGRLLPGAVGPAAQFMYENDAGERLTLYVGKAARGPDVFRALQDGDRRTFYWAYDRMGYALSGPAAEGKLREIAADVCSTLGGDPARW